MQPETRKSMHVLCSHCGPPTFPLSPLPAALSPLPTAAAKGKILGALAEADKNLVDGSDEFLQLLSAASVAQRVLMEAGA